MVTLDRLVGRREIPPPAIVKCDWEGAERDVLRGAEAVSRTHRPAIPLDTHSEEVQVPCGG